MQGFTVFLNKQRCKMLEKNYYIFINNYYHSFKVARVANIKSSFMDWFFL